MKKRILSILLALMVCVSLTPMTAMADGTPTEPPTKYDLWVGGVQITSTNCDNIVKAINDSQPGSASGTASYNASEKTLTLDNFKYTGGGKLAGLDPENESAGVHAALYYSNRKALNIIVTGKNSITYNLTDSSKANVFYGGYIDCKQMTISGGGSLKLNANDNRVNTSDKVNGRGLKYDPPTRAEEDFIIIDNTELIATANVKDGNEESTAYGFKTSLKTGEDLCIINNGSIEASGTTGAVCLENVGSKLDFEADRLVYVKTGDDMDSSTASYLKLSEINDTSYTQGKKFAIANEATNKYYKKKYLKVGDTELRIGDLPVTKDNKDKLVDEFNKIYPSTGSEIFAKGTASYDFDTHTLTLKEANFKIITGDASVCGLRYYGNDELTINNIKQTTGSNISLTGEADKKFSNDKYGIYIYKSSLNLTGDGMLCVNAECDTTDGNACTAIYSDSEAGITVNGVDITATSATGTGTSIGLRCKKLVVSSGSLTAIADDKAALHLLDNITDTKADFSETKVDVASTKKDDSSPVEYESENGDSYKYLKFVPKAGSTTVSVTGVSLNKETLSLEKDETATLTATVEPTTASNTNVSWKSSDTKVATVEDGTVTAVAQGTATITVTTVDGSKTASCTVTVTEVSAPPTVPPASGGGGGFYIPAQKPEIKTNDGGDTVLSSDGATLTIKPSNGKVIESVTLNGKDMGEVTELKGLKTGDKVEITFKDEAKTPTKEELDKKTKDTVSKMNFKARSYKLKNGNIRVQVLGDMQEIKDLGYTVKYQFYRSTQKSKGYKLMREGKTGKYTNTKGVKGTQYFYKARVTVYDADGNLIYKSAFKQCSYACRTWTKK